MKKLFSMITGIVISSVMITACSHGSQIETSRTNETSGTNETFLGLQSPNKYDQKILINDSEYTRPKVDDSKIIKECSAYYTLSKYEYINPNSIEFIMENFDGKIYKKGDIIDVKNELSSYKKPENYYGIYGCIYYTITSINKGPNLFEEIEVKKDTSNHLYMIDDKNNLVLKSNLSFKINIYIEQNMIGFIISEV